MPAPGSLVLIVAAGQAQDGRLVEASPIRFQDQQWQEMEASAPGIRATLEGVELSAITYLSDGLKVKGYLAVPQGDEKLPCVIFNRGGNREFGALTEERAAAILGELASWGYVARPRAARPISRPVGVREAGARKRSPGD